MNNVDQMMEDPYCEFNLLLDEAKPLRLLYNNSIEVITDGNYSVTNYTLYYIEKPTVITRSSSCNLPVEIHEDIVQLAYKQCLNNYMIKLGLLNRDQQK